MLPLCGSKLQLRFPVARDHAVTHTFSYLSMPLQATNRALRLMRMAPEGLFKACPPAACTIARPDLLLTCEALPFAGAASPLTCRAAPVNSSTFAALTTPEGLRSLRSASSLSFLVTCQRQVIPSHSFAALAALIVRRVNGFANQPMPVCISRRATSKGVERAPGSGTLPHA